MSAIDVKLMECRLQHRSSFPGCSLYCVHQTTASPNWLGLTHAQARSKETDLASKLIGGCGGDEHNDNNISPIR
jgi:hypothetical protein